MMSSNDPTAATGNQCLERSEEVRNLLSAVQERIVAFIQSADQYDFSSAKVEDASARSSALVQSMRPEELQAALNLEIPSSGQGQNGFLRILDQVLEYSVNTWHQGFLDKLYSSTNAPGVAAELIIASLNTNVHVYPVSPALTVIEKYTSKQVASLFGLDGPKAGGISVQGGSASNATSIVVARNTLFPKTKKDGCDGYKFVLFTSAHGHYSIEKAAQSLGFGSSAIWAVPVDQKGRMIPQSLERLIVKAKSEGRTPFYVNATAGTTVLGSFDPLEQIAFICRKHNLWFHVDASWGGSYAFSRRQRAKIAGSHLADSITVNPHKMLGVPVTCSFLLGADMNKFHRANTLPAAYLFHNDYLAADLNGNADVSVPDVWDLADMTLQCGRRADSLKLFLSWTYYGTEGYERQIDAASDMAAYFAAAVSDCPNLLLISENPPPCLQVCFCYAPNKQLVFRRDQEIEGNRIDEEERGKRNSKITEEVVQKLVHCGFMVDFAPPVEDDPSAGDGKFLRCVVNLQTKKETIHALIDAVLAVGLQVVGPCGRFVGAKPFRMGNPGERGHGPVVRH
ncbi:glutamate decarboxylase [Histoplasma capsulatum var. duboisii H88]|nr:glutamate decarboxylase [Histoplasma capsulatum var. duboisii H88]QSS49906.1 glutamate decarboxylase-like protein [Histoplasma capsulatum var. duboisii H88]